jgi:hypothetical protein
LPAPMGVAWRKDRPLAPLAGELIVALKACARLEAGSKAARTWTAAAR